MLFVQGCTGEHLGLVAGSFPRALVSPGTAAIEKATDLRDTDDVRISRLDRIANGQQITVNRSGVSQPGAIQGRGGCFRDVPGGG